LNDALQNMQGFVASVVGRPVTLPTISTDEPPSAACAKISAALNRPLPRTCGQIALFPSNKLTQAQRLVKAFDRAVILLLILTPLLAVGALALSRRRRRTLLQLAVAAAFGLVLIRRAVMWMEHTLVNTGRPENKSARTAILHHALHSYFTVSLWIVIGCLVVVVLALLSGPYRFAVKARHWVAVTGHEAVRVVKVGASQTTTLARDDKTVTWIRAHFDLLRASGYVVAILLLLVVGISFWGLLVILALLAGYEIWLHRLRPPGSVTLPESEPAGGTPQPSEPSVPAKR
jgi:hypothetical protein